MSLGNPDRPTFQRQAGILANELLYFIEHDEGQRQFGSSQHQRSPNYHFKEVDRHRGRLRELRAEQAAQFFRRASQIGFDLQNRGTEAGRQCAAMRSSLSGAATS